MLFLLRASRSPRRTLREIDDDGVERTFWLFSDGPWVVCLRTATGAVSVSCATGLTVALRDGGSVMVVEVGEA